MKRMLIIFSVLLAVVALLAACGGTPAPTATATGTAISLRIEGKTTKTLTIEDLKKMPAVSGWAGIKSSTGKITPPSQFKGVSLKDLCAVVGALDPDTGANVVAKDGYGITFSYDQLTQGKFTAFDPGTGEEVDPKDTLTAIVAYEKDGAPMPEDSDGALRLVVISTKQNQVTDGHWSVKWVTGIQVRAMSQEWTLNLNGAISEQMDRATFESCSAPKCHGVTWKDDTAQEWAGTPLWLLAARVDDAIKHDTGAYNVALADAGYSVEVVSTDGTMVTFTSAQLKKNNNIFVAYTANGNPLSEKDFPLRLAGSDLKKNERVGAIAKIHVLLPGASEAKPTTAPTTASTAAPTKAAAAATAPSGSAAGGAALTVLGSVDKPLSLTLDALKALGVEKVTAEHPKKGKTDYEGVRLSKVLAAASVKADATTLVFVASDGFTAEVAMADVNRCADCLISIADGALGTVMPGQPSSAWAKNLVEIKVK